MEPSIPPPSAEQIAIVKSLSDSNVIVDAIAGSGKTTTILHVAAEYPDRKILLLTYNSRLKAETRARVKYAFTNIECHSYHSFGYTYFDRSCSRDTGISEVLRAGTLPNTVFAYDIIVLDEAQDMSPLLYGLVCHIYSHNTRRALLCVVGDRNQCIFKFKEADDRYIQFAESLFSFAPFPWRSHSLSTSYRVTAKIASFVNCMMGHNRIKNTIINDSELPVRYLIANVFADRMLRDISAIINGMVIKYGVDQVFVLAPSLRSNGTPVRKLANELIKRDIPIFVANEQIDSLSDKVTRGKVTFASFHQVKGLERDVVIIFNFDKSYSKYYNRDYDPCVCPNELYVAMTRARRRLIVVHHYQNEFLEFVKFDALTGICAISGSNPIVESYTSFKESHPTYSVTDIVRHLPTDVIISAMKMLEVCRTRESTETIKLETITKQGELFEDVSDITGVAIAAYHEIRLTGDCYIAKCLEKSVDRKIEIPQLLRIANKYIADRDGYKHKLAQIQSYDWIERDVMKKCLARMRACVSTSARFEVRVVHRNSDFTVNGFIDCFDLETNTIWEFKCVRELLEEHLLQLAIYAYIIENGNMYYDDRPFKPEGARKYVLYNVLTDEKWTLTYNSDISNMVYMLIASRRRRVSLSDEAFLALNADICLRSLKLKNL